MYAEEYICDMLSLLHYGTKVFGLSPYARIKNNYRVSLKGSLFTLGLFSFHLMNGFVFLSRAHLVWQNIILKIMFGCKMYLSFISTIFLYLNEIKNQDKFGAILKTLKEVDSLIQNHGMRIPYRKSKITIGFIVAALYITIFLTTLMMFVAYPQALHIKKMSLSMIFILPDVCHGALTCIFCTYISLIRQRFRIMNKCILERFLETIKYKNQHPFYLEKYDDVNIIHDMKKAHYKLSILARKLHSMYSIHLLFIIFIGYNSVFTTVYLWFSISFHGLNGIKISMIIQSMSSMLFNVIPMFAVIICNHNCSSEVQETPILLFRITKATNNPYIYKWARAFILQLTTTSTKIYTAGVLELNKQLLKTIVSSALINLTILIQFDIASI